MNRPLFKLVALGIVGIFASFSLGEDPAAQPSTQPSSAAPDRVAPDHQKISAYGLGYDLVWRSRPIYKNAAWDLDLEMLIQGIRDAYEDNPAKYTDTEVEAAVEALFAAVAENEKVVAEKAVADDEKFLAENKAKPGVTTTASGLQIEHLREGDGAMPAATDEIRVHYKGTFPNGNTFDSSYDRDEPAIFKVSQVIEGFKEGLMLTKVGGKSRLVIPYELAYGASGRPPAIPPKATLVFEIELLEIMKPGASNEDHESHDHE